MEFQDDKTSDSSSSTTGIQEDGEDCSTHPASRTSSTEDADVVMSNNQVIKQQDPNETTDTNNDSTDSEEVKGGTNSDPNSSATPPENSQAAPKSADVEPKKPKPKIRIKLKLPFQANNKRKLPLSTADPSKDTASAVKDTNASRPAKAFKKTLPLSKHVTGTGSRRRPVAPSKQVKIPPLASPGLLVPGKPTPRDTFDMAMAGAGYTKQQRVEHPHRGSSVQRTIGDMFDTDVRLALHPIELAPKALLNGSVERDGETTKLVDLFANSFGGNELHEAKTMPFRDMVPLSLTLSYPTDYADARQGYAEKVRERERLIVEYQEAAYGIEVSADEGVQKINPIKVPPIPDPPKPPTVDELGLDKADFRSKPEHPIYLPSKAELVAHLDPECFHITQGRYFGLSSNKIADPNVCGPSAAGFSGTSGLATATTSTTTSTSGISGGGMALILSAGFHCAAAVPLKESSSFKPNTPLALPVAPTETANSLRLIMMDDTWADRFRLVILKAAVYAARTEVYDATFTGPNKLVYPDLGKAFSMYTQIKPCARCKSNKQGVYHCRIRRRHKEEDFDGGSSFNTLDPYLEVPLESLLIS